MTTQESIIETVNKLFVYTDAQNWDKLMTEVFTEMVHLDMVSMGGEAANHTAQAICQMWEEGFKDLDAVNHLAGNHLVELESHEKARAHCYATATHFKKAATQGQTREFVGTYDLKLQKTEDGWRIYSFLYNLKYSQGNMSLE